MNGLSEDMISFMDKTTNKYGYVNLEGKIIIPAIFENAYSFKDGLAVVNLPDKDYYIKAGVIDKTGKEINSLPKFKGNGSAIISKDLIEANIDQKLSYVLKSGKAIWQESTNTALNDGISINSIKYSPDRSLLNYYPEVKGLKDSTIQANINATIKESFLRDSAASKRHSDGSYAESSTFDFQASQNKNLLLIQRTGYTMPNGSAHGMPIKQYYHIDLKTGTTYKLSDLFKSNSQYVSKLSIILKAKMEKMNKEEDKAYSSDTFIITRDQGFYITKDALNIYFNPYEIACYAEGFPNFSISYNEIKDIINTDGSFGKSFN